MGIFDFLLPKTEERAAYNTQTVTSESVDEPFSLDSLFSTDSITEEKILNIPTAKACLELITSTIASMPVYLYQENPDGTIEKVNDRRLKLLNHEANDFLTGSSLKKHMAKDYLLHGASYVSIIEAANRILELHPLPARDIVINKKIANGYRTVGAEILLSTAEHGAINEFNKKQVKFKPYELMITLGDTHDGLTAKGLLKNGQELFSQALSEMEYTKNLYERGALPLGLLKTENRLTETQANSLRTAWKNLYGGVKNSAKTVVLQEGMDYQALSMNPEQIQMNATRSNTNSEICKLFNVPESMISAQANKYGSIEQNNLHFLKHTLAPVIVAIESAMDKALLLESEKDNGFFFRFDTSELVRATEKERVDAVVAGVSGGIFTLNEGRSKFDLPPLEQDALMLAPGAQAADPETGEITVNGEKAEEKEEIEGEEPDGETGDSPTGD